MLFNQIQPYKSYVSWNKFLNSVLNTLLIATPQCKYNKGRSELCERKQKRNEFDERNARTWVRILSFIYFWQGAEATARNIVINKCIWMNFLKKLFNAIFKCMINLPTIKLPVLSYISTLYLLSLCWLFHSISAQEILFQDF